MSSDQQALFPQSQLELKENIDVSPATNPTKKAIMDGVGPTLLGPSNTRTTCPFCAASIKTSVRYTTTTRTHITAWICCMLACCWCAPYCMTSTRNADHYCPNCQLYLGTYKK